MNEKLVLDAGVLSLHFADHRGVGPYFDAITAGRSKGLISSFNLAEFYYKTCQKLGKQTADTWYFQVRNSELNIINREELVRLAGLEKCRQSHRLALADCFALALAKAEGALLLTTDGELAKIRDANVKHIKL
ncbi:MAG: PIN domain-containing protein [Thaumarchaeota archaeon]|nr:PIN domain-containing protein [Nitrososphaerota archaeon]